jgi:peroxidase
MASDAQITALRAIGGADNNLVHPELNATPGASEIRLGARNFAPGTTDGITPGANARTISNVVTDGRLAATADPGGASAWQYVMGQFVDHDLDLEHPDSTNPLNVAVPAGDPVLADGTQIPMGGRAQLDSNHAIVNTIAGYLDLSQVYGSDAMRAEALRNQDGTLKTSDGNNLPLLGGKPFAGDVRVAENPELIAVTTLFVREHNWWVGKLGADNPTWTGDQLYNIARAITTAEYQQVVYNEFLPSLLGPNGVPAYHGYDPNVSSQVSMEFATSAFRVGHSQVSGEQEGLDNQGKHTFQETLAQSFFNTPQQTSDNGIDNLLRHISSDPSQATDVFAVNDLRNLLAAPPQAIDLIAIDIQRERDVGLGTLNQTREAIGLPAYTSFEQITQDPDVLARLHQVFPTVDDVDLFIGGLAEPGVNGGALGDTFAKIVANQFDALRTGDRFYWQNQEFSSSLTQVMQGTKLSTILSRNSNTPDLQSSVFVRAERHSSDTVSDEPNDPQLVIGIDDDNAKISGGLGDDTLFAGKGLHQTLFGNGGADVFIFGGQATDDTIADFGKGDKLDLRGSLDASGTVVERTEIGGTALQVGASTLHLTHITPQSLSASDFVQPVHLVVGSA